MSSSSSIDLSQPLPDGTSVTIFVVHRGYMKNKETNEQALADAVCSRASRKDAESVAQVLNQAQEGVMYLKWVASQHFPLAKGTGDELLQKSEDPVIQQQWEALIAPHRQDVYSVAELKIVNEEDVKEYMQVLDEESAKQGAT